MTTIKIVPLYYAGGLKLSQHSIDRCQADIFAGIYAGLALFAFLWIIG